MKVLYIGGFEMPDGNAAAQRVLGVAKLMRLNGCDVHFVGLSRKNRESGVIDGFTYHNLPYPKTTIQWLSYLTGGGKYSKIIKDESPDVVVFYNHPALAIERLNHFCQKNGIRTLADVTEWYEPDGSWLFRKIKGFDTNRRMRSSHLKLNGLITISRYLDDYYASRTNIPHILLPPLVDIEQFKWKQPVEHDNSLTVIYAGSPGGNKDRLDLIIESLGTIDVPDRFKFKVIGITEVQYHNIWNVGKTPEYVEFMGRLNHQEVIRELLNADFQLFVRTDSLTNKAGFPTKFVETITSGTLPITNLSSNLSDYLTDGINGFIIPSVSQDDIRATLQKALSLTQSQISEMKSNVNKKTFDYHNYIVSFNSFFKCL